jgi:hypothetical protein
MMLIEIRDKKGHRFVTQLNSILKGLGMEKTAVVEVRANTEPAACDNGEPRPSLMIFFNNGEGSHVDDLIEAFCKHDVCMDIYPVPCGRVVSAETIHGKFMNLKKAEKRRT